MKKAATIEEDVPALIGLIRFCVVRSRSSVNGGRLPKSMRTFGVRSAEGKKVGALFLTPGYAARAPERIKAQGRILRALATGYRGSWPHAADPTEQLVHDAAWNLYAAAIHASIVADNPKQQRLFDRVALKAQRALDASRPSEEHGWRRMSWAGYNRFDVVRDAPEIPKMANLVAKVDAAYAASSKAPPWDRARMVLRAEYAAFAENHPAERTRWQKAMKRGIRELDAMEAAERASGVIRTRPITDATFGKWYFAAEGVR